MPGFAVTALALAHFRSHRALRLALDGRPVAVFGPNGAGKTNLLEAISMLSPGRGLRRAETADLVQRPEAPGWRVAAAVDGPAGRHEIDTRSEAGQTREVRIDGKAAPQAALGRVLRVIWMVPAMDRLWLEAAEGRRRFLDRVALSFDPDHAEAALAYDRALRERNRLLREGLSDGRWFGAIEAQMGAAGAALARGRRVAVDRLAAAQDGAGGAFPRAGLAMAGDDAGPEEAGALAAALAAGRRRDMAAGRTLLGPHRADLAAVLAAKGMPAADCSTGEQKALLISLVLANARALAAETGAPPVILLDEVAAHLDPGRREALYDEIAALGAQAVMTGTEAGLFEALGERGQRFAVTEEAGESRVAPA